MVFKQILFAFGIWQLEERVNETFRKKAVENTSLKQITLIRQICFDAFCLDFCFIIF